MVKRLIPMNTYDTAAMEQWLSEMADEGLLLDSFSGKKAKFQDDCCQKVKYRMIPLSEKAETPSSEMKTLFEENGWEFVTHLQEKFFVFLNRDAYPKPIPFSKEEERVVYEIMKKDKRNSFFLAIAAFLFFLGVQIFFLFLRFDDYILGEEYFNDYIFFIVIIVNGLGAIREYRSYDLVKRKLESETLGEEEDSPYIPTTKWIRTETILNILVFVFTLAPIVSEYRADYNSEKLTKVDIPFSYVSLEEIENIEGKSELLENDTYIDKKASLFAPIQYEIDQYGSVSYIDSKYGLTEKSHLKLHYIELAQEIFASRTLDAMMHHDDAIKVEQDGLDEAWIEEGSPGTATNIYLLKGTKILEIKYWGDGDIRSYIDEFSQSLLEYNPVS